MAVDLAEFDLTPPARELVEIALTDIDLMHQQKAYHNVYHTLSVMRWSHALAGYYDMSQDDRSSIVTAAAYHDYVHGLGHGEDEAASAAQLRENMEAMGLGRAAIFGAVDLIDGTVIEKIDGRLTQKAARSGHLGARILADADLSGLGSPLHHLLPSTHALLEERYPGADSRSPEMFKLLGEAVQLLAQEPLTEAAQVMLPHRQENLAKVVELRAQIGDELGLAA